MDPVLGPKKIGLIGLGLMGRPMGMNLIKAGYSLAVWNRTASRAEELVAAGAKLAKSPQEVAASADFLFSIVSDPPALEQVLWGPQRYPRSRAAALTLIPAPYRRRWPEKSPPPALNAASVFWTRPSPAATGAPKKANCFS